MTDQQIFLMKPYPQWFVESTRNDFGTEEVIDLLGLPQTKNSQVKLHQIRCDHTNRRKVFVGAGEEIQSRPVKGKLTECTYREIWNESMERWDKHPQYDTGDYYHLYGKNGKKGRSVFYTQQGVLNLYSIFSEREKRKETTAQKKWAENSSPKKAPAPLQHLLRREAA